MLYTLQQDEWRAVVVITNSLRSCSQLSPAFFWYRRFAIVREGEQSTVAKLSGGRSFHAIAKNVCSVHTFLYKKTRLQTNTQE